MSNFLLNLITLLNNINIKASINYLMHHYINFIFLKTITFNYYLDYSVIADMIMALCLIFQFRTKWNSSFIGLCPIK